MKQKLAVLCIFILGSSVALAENLWLDHQMNQVFQKINAGDTEGAIDILRNTLQAALQKDDVPDEDTAMVANELAMIYMAQGAFNKAEPFMIKALKLEENAYGKGNVMTAGTMNNLALLYTQAGKLSEAESLYKKVASVWRAEGGNEDPEYIQAQMNLIDIYEQQGRTREANALREQLKNSTDDPSSPEEGSNRTIIDNNQVIFTTEGEEEEEWNAPQAGETENYTQTRSEYSVSTSFSINPCVDPLTYDSVIGRKAVESLLKGGGGVYERGTKLALIKLYTDYKSLGIKPVHINNIMTHFGSIIRAADAMGALMASDYEAAVDNAVKGGVILGLTLKGIPMVGEMITALEITQASFEELKKQEDMLKVDCAFYQFMDDTKLQSLIQKGNWRDVSDYYINNYIMKDQLHRDRSQAYIDSVLGERVDLNLNSSNPFEVISNIGLHNANPKLRTFVITMLKDFDQKRKNWKKASQQAMQLRNDPLYNHLRTLMAATEDLAIAHEFFNEWCEEYSKLAGEPSEPEGDQVYELVKLTRQEVKVTGTNYSGVPRDAEYLDEVVLKSGSGSISVGYDAQWQGGFGRMNGNVSYQIPERIVCKLEGSNAVPLEQYKVHFTASANWSNEGLGFGRPTGIIFERSSAEVAKDHRGIIANESASASLDADVDWGYGFNDTFRVEFHGFQNHYVIFKTEYALKQ